MSVCCSVATLKEVTRRSCSSSRLDWRAARASRRSLLMSVVWRCRCERASSGSRAIKSWRRVSTCTPSLWRFICSSMRFFARRRSAFTTLEQLSQTRLVRPAPFFSGSQPSQTLERNAQWCFTAGSHSGSGLGSRLDLALLLAADVEAMGVFGPIFEEMPSGSSPASPAAASVATPAEAMAAAPTAPMPSGSTAIASTAAASPSGSTASAPPAGAMGTKLAGPPGPTAPGSPALASASPSAMAPASPSSPWAFFGLRPRFFVTWSPRKRSKAGGRVTSSEIFMPALFM
mmetsp:Transcript_39849/g.124570  ORF Transcript_39849/g.124570 Transcript_39849/m.124570 type:complete len:288 (+) Transcript_39849:484-1347(+)